MSGPIPPELGGLVNLARLALSSNELTGSIPSELGRLANLQVLNLAANGLHGRIPHELGSLASLRVLTLGANELNGPIPPELGELARLEHLTLHNNQLTGPVPSEFRGMASLHELLLSNNSDLAGPLSADLTALNRLDKLLAGGTGLCAPSDPDIQAWLEGIERRWIALCSDGEPSAAYLTQSVQSRRFPVPLVAGEEALLRVFPTAKRATSEGIPVVRARFFHDGREAHVEEIPGKSVPIPTAVDEGNLDKSVNAQIPGHLIQPGLEMVIEIDPHGTLDPALGVTTRIPASGRIAVEVKTMPLFDLTLIPFIWEERGDSSIVDLVGAMAADPENHEMLEDTRTLLPIADLEVRAHEAVLSSTNNGHDLLAQTEAIRVMEGGAGHYMGTMAQPLTGPSGVAHTPGRSSFSIPGAGIIAHELGHNLSLGHAPCGVRGADPLFPYPDGSIGAWGYDLTGGGRLLSPTTSDLMSYCGPKWISDYYFTQAYRFRLSDAGGMGADRSAATVSRGLLLWGGVDADSVPFLEPAFVIDAPPALPQRVGEYRLTGRTVDDTALFTLSFSMQELADGDGISSFAFVLPVRPAWEGNLASITLTGPGVSATLDGDNNEPMVILRNRRNGQVRGILRDLPSLTQTAADAMGQGPEPELQVLFSRGIPGADAWRR